MRAARILLPAGGGLEPVVAGELHSGSFPKTLIVWERVVCVALVDCVDVPWAGLFCGVFLGEALFFSMVCLVAERANCIWSVVCWVPPVSWLSSAAAASAASASSSVADCGDVACCSYLL